EYSGSYVPDADRPVVVARGEGPSVGAEAERIDVASRPVGGCRPLPRRQVEERDAAVGVAEGGKRSAGRERRSPAELERLDLIERARVEELRHAFVGRDEQIAPVGGVTDQPAAHDRLRLTLGSTGS